MLCKRETCTVKKCSPGFDREYSERVVIRLYAKFSVFTDQKDHCAFVGPVSGIRVVVVLYKNHLNVFSLNGLFSFVSGCFVLYESFCEFGSHDHDTSGIEVIVGASKDALDFFLRYHIPDGVINKDRIIRFTKRKRAHVPLYQFTAGVKFFRQGEHIDADIKTRRGIPLLQVKQVFPSPASDVKQRFYGDLCLFFYNTGNESVIRSVFRFRVSPHRP